MRRLAMGLILLLGLVFGSTSCLVHVKSTRRAGKSCGAGKVWVKRGHKWKCKKGKHHRKRKGVEKRDHRDKVKKRDHRD